MSSSAACDARKVKSIMGDERRNQRHAHAMTDIAGFQAGSDGGICSPGSWSMWLPAPPSLDGPEIVTALQEFGLVDCQRSPLVLKKV